MPLLDIYPNAPQHLRAEPDVIPSVHLIPLDQFVGTGPEVVVVLPQPLWAEPEPLVQHLQDHGVDFDQMLPVVLGDLALDLQIHGFFLGSGHRASEYPAARFFDSHCMR